MSADLPPVLPPEVSEVILPAIAIWLTIGFVCTIGASALGWSSGSSLLVEVPAYFLTFALLKRRFLANRKRTAEQPGEATKRRGERSR